MNKIQAVDILDLAAQHGKVWPLDDDITNAELEKLFHLDNKKDAGIPYAVVDSTALPV